MSAVAQDTGFLYENGQKLRVKFAAIAASAQNANEVVAAVTGKKIRVLAYFLSSSGSTNAKWQSSSTDKSGLHYMVANTIAPSPYSPVGLFETAAGEALNLHLSAAVAVGGWLVYVEASPATV